MSKKAKKAKTQPRKTVRAPRPAPQSTALMRVQVQDRDNLLLIPEQPAAPQNLAVLTDDPTVANLGLVEVKLTDVEEATLAEPVNPAQVLIKPTGQPYLPHKVYTQWFNRALGRFGWSLVAAGKPTKVPLGKPDAKKPRHLVLVPYLLRVHGQPVAFAWGEQEYSEHNNEQTYGDAVEATVANGLRRCAKRIGVGLELWDRDWLETWRKEHAVRVKVKYPSSSDAQWRWRRKADPRLPFEVDGRGSNNAPPEDEGGVWQDLDAEYVEQAAPRQRPPAGNDGNGGQKITDPQRRRLATIASKAGRDNQDVLLYLRKVWKVNSSKDILRKDYDAICRVLEAPGALPLPGDGEGQ